MKKILALLMALTMLLALCACGADKAESAASAAEEPAAAPAEEAPADAEPAAEEPAAVSFEPVSAKFSDCEVTILGAESFIDSDDKEAVRFYYDYTNLRDYPYSAWLSFDTYAEEDGYELMSTYAWSEDDVPEYGNRTLSILPGLTIRCVAEFSYKPDGSELTFRIENYEDEILTATFDPANLPGRPDVWTIDPITEPWYAAGYEAAGESEDAAISIQDTEFFQEEDWMGSNDCIRVYFEYTNLEESDSYLTSMSTVRLFQDGVELDSGWTMDDVETDSLWYESIPSGETIVVSNNWCLRSDSPIEIVVSDWWTDEVICAQIVEVG